MKKPMLNDEVVKVIKNIRYLKKQSQILILCFIGYLIEIDQKKTLQSLYELAYLFGTVTVQKHKMELNEVLKWF